MRTGLVTLVAWFAVAGSPGLADASCPVNWMNVEDVGYPSYGPTATLSSTNEGPVYVAWEAGSPCTAGCYDLPHGWIESHGYNTLYGGVGTSVRVEDEYWIEGPAAGAPIAFEAVILVHSTIC
jgi:hypothetical protein